jgi:hypothetical protein
MLLFYDTGGKHNMVFAIAARMVWTIYVIRVHLECPPFDMFGCSWQTAALLYQKELFTYSPLKLF